MAQSITFVSRRYTTRSLWSLFLMCAFPLHVWTITLVLRDVSWVAERTNVWDAIGVGAYGLLFTFIESCAVFLVFALLGLILPSKWTADKRISFLILLVMILSIWGIISQLLFLWNINLPPFLIQLLARSGRPLVGLYLISLALVVPSVILPVFQFIRSSRMEKVLLDFVDRLSPLVMTYLVLDAAGLIVVLIRNFS